MGGVSPGHGEREPITEVWGEAPSGVQGQNPWWVVRGQSPPEAERILAVGRPVTVLISAYGFQ